MPTKQTESNERTDADDDLVEISFTLDKETADWIDERVIETETKRIADMLGVSESRVEPIVRNHIASD